MNTVLRTENTNSNIPLLDFCDYNNFALIV